MHAVRAGRSRYVETIVDEESRRVPPLRMSGTRRQFVKHACRKRFLAYLNKRNLGATAASIQPEYVGKLRIVRSCFGCRRAARYCVDNRWKLERHCLDLLGRRGLLLEERLPSD